jgi:hypothetical protein
VLGLTATDSEALRDALLEAARLVEATPGNLDEYGQRYTLDFIMVGPAGTATVRSGWIVRTDEDFARFVTGYVL